MDGRFLTVMALLDPDGGVQVFPGFSTTSDHRVLSGHHSEYTAVFLGADGQTLSEQSLGAEDLCTDGGPPAGLALVGKIPFPARATALRISRHDDVLVELGVPETGPEVELTWEPGERVESRITVTWTARHGDDRPVYSIVVYDPVGDDSWRPVSLVTTERSHDVDLRALPGGSRCRLGVVCSDGFNTTQVASRPFSLPPRPCEAFIFAPLDGERFRPGERVVLRGQGYWMEEDRPEIDELTWWSSLDGQLGSGATLAVVLSPGLHTLTLVAGHGDRTGSAAVTTTVEGDRPRA
jgi:hypothetical protein